MAEIASAYISLIPSMKGAQGKISSELGGELDAAGKKGGKRLGSGLSSSFLPATKAMAGAAAGIFAAAKIGGFLKDSIAEARESQKVGALTAQVIKTTGGAAKITAGQVGDLATAISNKTGIDDEAIQSASNLLLTFTNVRNEVGKGNDVFNQATKIATDMGAALGTEPKAAAIQLGKALNDPIKGVTALSRVGVSFTKQQKDQIKTLVGSGKSLDAQKIILKELNKEFGGAAAASATAGEKFGVAFGNFKESIGTALLPVIDKVMVAGTKLVGYLSANVGPAFAAIGKFIKPVADGFKYLFTDGADGAQSFAEVLDNVFGNSGKLVAPLRVVGQVIKDVVLGVRAMFLAFQNGDVTSNGLVGTFERIGVTVRALIPAIQAFVTGTLLPLLGQAASFITTRVVPAVMGIITAFRGYLAVVIPIVQAFVTGMMARIRPMMPQIRAIFSTIGSIIVQVMGLIQAVIQRVTSVIQAIWSRWGSNIMNFAAKIFSSLLAIIGGALRIIQGIIKTVTSLIRGDWSGAWEGIKQIVSGAWQVIKATVSGALSALGGIIRGAGALLKAAMSSVGDKINGALDGLANALRAKGAELIQRLIDGILGKIEDVKRAAGRVAQAIKDHFPGSPVKTGPLTSWNNGGAGKRLGGMLADGLTASQRTVAAASLGLAGAVAIPVAGATSLAAGAGGAGVVINGNVGWMPDEVAAKIDARQRDAAALYNLQGVG